MKSRHLFLFALLTLLTIILLSACVRPASTPSTSKSASGTTTADFPVPGTTEDVMSQLESLATQTAMAASGGSAGAQQTPVATLPAATPWHGYRQWRCLHTRSAGTAHSRSAYCSPHPASGAGCCPHQDARETILLHPEGRRISVLHRPPL